MANRMPVIAGNWKMNHGPAAAQQFFSDFLSRYEPRQDRRVIVFPPAISIGAAIESVRQRRDIEIGVQNIHWEASGAFTGETSAPMAAEAGARIVLAGHSERRHVFGETDEQVARKVAAALAARLDVMLCVGETLEQRKADRLEMILERQVDTALAPIDSVLAPRISLAYEPVWAIGTGVNATPDDATTAHRFLRKCIESRFGHASAASMAILYGGSVNPGNAQSLLAAKDVDGLLIGGASLKPESFAALAAQD
jgi:triosephosphate isomerase (TIM)